jgi:hypothetical protein
VVNDHKQQERVPEGKEGGGAHQEGPHSIQAGQTQRREESTPEQAPETGRSNQASKDQRDK